MNDAQYQSLLKRILALETRGGFSTSVGGGTGGGITDLTGDVTASGTGSVVATIPADTVTNAQLVDMVAHAIKARKTNTTGNPEDATLSEVLDFIGSAAQGDLLYRGAATWARLAAGTSGHALITNGAAADPSWGAPVGASGLLSVSGTLTDAQIRGMFAAPITIVGAPGTGFTVAPIEFHWASHFTAGAYAQNNSLNLYWNGVGPAAGIMAPVTAVTNLAGEKFVTQNVLTSGTINLTATENMVLSLSNATSALTGGNAANTLDYTVKYYLIAV